MRYEADGEKDARPLETADRLKIDAQFEALSREGYRVLGIASRQVGVDHPQTVVHDHAGAGHLHHPHPQEPLPKPPSTWLIACSLTVVALAAVLPFTPAGVHLGFVAVPACFSLILTAVLLA